MPHIVAVFKKCQNLGGYWPATVTLLPPLAEREQINTKQTTPILLLPKNEKSSQASLSQQTHRPWGKRKSQQILLHILTSVRIFIVSFDGLTKELGNRGNCIYRGQR